MPYKDHCSPGVQFFCSQGVQFFCSPGVQFILQSCQSLHKQTHTAFSLPSNTAQELSAPHLSSQIRQMAMSTQTTHILLHSSVDTLNKKVKCYPFSPVKVQPLSTSQRGFFRCQKHVRFLHYSSKFQQRRLELAFISLHHSKLFKYSRTIWYKNWYCSKLSMNCGLLMRICLTAW